MVAHFMYRDFAGGAFSSNRLSITYRSEAAQRIKVLALAGNVDITAEIVDADGEVICSYEKGVWRDASLQPRPL
jgi:hypothetical protein